MKILIINGSPTKGNTWLLTGLVKERLLKIDPDTEFEEVHLSELNLPFCTGCSLCFRKGHTFCPHNQIMQGVMDKIAACDGLIFSSVCFQMNVPALTKNLLDHMCFMMHRPRYYDKKALVISTVGGVGVGGTVKYIMDTLYGWGFNRCYSLPVRAASWNAYKPTESDLSKADKVSKRFIRDLASKKLHSPKATLLIPFNLFRAMSRDYAPGTEYATQDGVYWSDPELKDRCYFSQVPVPFYKRLFGKMFYLLGRIVSPKIMVTYKKS